MSNGVCVLAQNNNTTNYVEQTYALALSILANAPNTNFSIITNDLVPKEYKDVFDQVIPIPWDDRAAETSWKIENRWKIYHTTPYKNTIVFDADMLALDNITPMWENVDPIIFTNTVTTYRNEIVTNRYYRKVFDSNNLPNIYSGVYQFSKCNNTHTFFKLLDTIMYSWYEFYQKYTPNDTQYWNSFDVSAAIALKVLDCNIKNNLTFTHMKPHVQNWSHVPSKWTDVLPVDFGNDKLYIGGYKQSGVLHYVEDEFLTPDMLKWLEERI
tara:strand:- start:841 stop:1647 length:807 start_codon:yes stop_codon:yes gene_type:complete